MFWIGITGLVASGKSELALAFQDLGYKTLSADSLAAQVFSSKEKQIYQYFGLASRTEIREAIFADANKKAFLEDLIIPEVKKLASAQRSEWSSEGCRLAFYEAPLLFQKGAYNQVDEIIFMDCSDEMILDRLKKRGLSNQMAIQILEDQKEVRNKKSLCKFVFENTGSAEDLKSFAKQTAERLISGS